MYYRAILAFLDDTVLDLNDFLTQNKFINKLRNRDRVKEIVKRERASPNQSDKLNYISGTFMAHLRALDDSCGCSSSLSRSNSFSRREGRRSTGKLHALKQELGTAVNSMEANVFLNNDDSVFDYAVNNLNLD